jgi:O-antigen/teichoic acid export membrane protein
LIGAGKAVEEKPRTGEFSSSRTIARNTIARGAGEIAAKLGSLAFYAVMARKLGAEDFGSFIFALSLSSVVLIAAGFGMDAFMTREIAKNRDSVHVLLSNVMVLKGSMLFALIGVLGGIVLIGPYSAGTRIAVVVVGAGVAVEMLSATLHSVAQGFERMEVGAVGLVVQRTLTAIVGIAVVIAGGGLIAAALVFLGGSVVGYVVTMVYLRRVVRIEFRPNRSQFMEVLKVSAPIGVAVLMFTVLLRLDATLISFLTHGDQAEVAHYGAAYRLIDATMFVPWVFSAAMLPWVARQSEQDSEVLARGSAVGLKLLVAFLMPIGIGYVVFAPSLIDILYGSGFKDAIVPLRFLGMMTVLYAVNAYASSVLIARHQPAVFARGIAFVLVLNLILNVLLIPPYGASGAAFAAIVTGTILAAYSVWKIRVAVGRFSLPRALAGPLVAGAVLAATALLSGLPFGVAAVISTLAYVLVLLCFERALFSDDLALLAGFIRGGSAPKHPVGGAT